MTRDANGRLSEKEARADLLYVDERARTILLALHAVRFVTGPLVLGLLGIHPSNVSRRLNALYHHRYLERMPHLVQRSTGSPRHVYTLDVLGREYVEEATGCVDERQRRPDRPASAYFIEHYLAIAAPLESPLQPGAVPSREIASSGRPTGANGAVYVALQVAARAAGLSLAWLNEVVSTSQSSRIARPSSSMIALLPFTSG